MKGNEPAFPRTRVGGVQNDWGASGFTKREIMVLLLTHALIATDEGLGMSHEARADWVNQQVDALLDHNMDSDTE